MAAGRSADAAGARVVHHVPGRMRIRIEGARDRDEMLHAVQPLLARLPGPASIRISASSGSVIIRYPTSGQVVAPDAAISTREPRAALAPKLLVPVALGVATRLLSRRRRSSVLWLDLLLLAFDAWMKAQRPRQPDHQRRMRRTEPVHAARHRPP
jgi:hypothetical protein